MTGFRLSFVLFLLFNAVIGLDHKFKITNNGKGKGYFFGWSISATSRSLVVGSPDDETYTGAAMIYTRPTPTTVETRYNFKVQPDFQSQFGVQFGQSVATNEKFLVTGTFNQPPLTSTSVPGPRSTSGTEDDSAVARERTKGNFIFIYSAGKPHTSLQKLSAGLVGIDQVGISADHTVVAACGGYLGRWGAVHTYRYQDSTWNHSQTITNNEFDRSLSVVVSNSQLLVGVPYANSNAGLVHIYGRSNGRWVLKEKLRPLQEPGSYFGGSLALHGNRLVAAAPGKKEVHIYNYINGVWRSEGVIQDSNFSPLYSQMGVAIEGNKLAVVTESVGLAVVYEMKSHGKWSEKVVLKAKGESMEENHGKCVVINGDLVFTSYADRTRKLPGAVYVHDLSKLGYNINGEV